MRPVQPICSRCGIRPKVARPDGRLRSWCAVCESAQKVAYQRTPAGKATIKRYQQTENGKQHNRAGHRRFRARQKALRSDPTDMGEKIEALEVRLAAKKKPKKPVKCKHCGKPIVRTSNAPMNWTHVVGGVGCVGLPGTQAEPAETPDQEAAEHATPQMP